jgi:hypothetical protein
MKGAAKMVNQLSNTAISSTKAMAQLDHVENVVNITVFHGPGGNAM